MPSRFLIFVYGHFSVTVHLINLRSSVQLQLAFSSTLFPSFIAYFFMVSGYQFCANFRPIQKRGNVYHMNVAKERPKVQCILDYKFTKTTKVQKYSF
ncbi:hypothetical protein JHK87_041712 [Glycine soja]|nr:hypothetical protein JHK87_041712 [Glycine soja]